MSIIDVPTTNGQKPHSNGSIGKSSVSPNGSPKSSPPFRNNFVKNFSDGSDDTEDL